MTDTTFTASYILTDTILETYIGSDPRASAIALKALASTSQAWYCQRATKTIDAIPLTGYKLLSTQALQFPRKYNPSEYLSPWGAIVTEDMYGYIYDSSDVPQDVINACAEEAIALYQFYADTDNIDRESMKGQGVESYNLGGVYSETLKSSFASLHFGLHSAEAYGLLEKFIQRGANII